MDPRTRLEEAHRSLGDRAVAAAVAIAALIVVAFAHEAPEPRELRGTGTTTHRAAG